MHIERYICFHFFLIYQNASFCHLFCLNSIKLSENLPLQQYKSNFFHNLIFYSRLKNFMSYPPPTITSVVEKKLDIIYLRSGGGNHSWSFIFFKHSWAFYRDNPWSWNVHNHFLHVHFSFVSRPARAKVFT